MMKEQNRLILWCWFQSEIVKNVLIPDVEKNIAQYGAMFPSACEAFHKKKFAEHSLYFHHAHVENPIPMGHEYKKIALMENYKILPDTVQTCTSKIICFFAAGPSGQPSEYAMCGHHENCLIQFEQGIPQMIYDELLEITELPFNLIMEKQFHKKQICLY